MTHDGPCPAPGEVPVVVDGADLDGLLGFHPDPQPGDHGAVARLRAHLDEALAAKRSGVLPRNRALPADVVDIVTDGPDQGDPAAWLNDGGDSARAALAPVLANLTGEHDAEELDSWAGAVLAHVQAATRAAPAGAALPCPAVAAAPPGDEDESDYVFLRDHIIATLDVRDGEDAEVALLMDAVTRAGRLARLLVRDRAALARIKTQRDDKRQHVSDLAVDLAVDLGALLTPPAGHEDEAAVERAFCEVEQWEVMEPLEQPNGQWHEQTRTEVRAMLRAALAAARGPRTPDPGDGA